MQVILGVIFHFIGGFASGSFYMPFKKVRGWNWESYWIIGGLFSWLIVPPLAAFLTIPGFTAIISETSFDTIKYVLLFGVLWGIGGCTYGLGVRYLGVSLGSSIILGLCMVFGALVPAIYYEFTKTAGKDPISIYFNTKWGLIVLGGMLVCIIGIIIAGKAGMMKEKELRAASSGKAADPSPTDAHGAPAGKTEYKFALGMTVGIISGILSACFNFGIEAGEPMKAVADAAWKTAHPAEEGKFLFGNNVTYVVLLWGGLATNLVWCMILNARNKSFGDYTNKKTPLLRNYLFAALAGTTWFLQFFFYGMGESKLGNGASSWILHMAFIILIANMWGVIANEWKGTSKKTKQTIAIGIAVIIVSVLVVGYGNSLKP
ncbi:MAG TPA: L-rhamnose/proton symporter RhaT [Chitinophagaceae bacterium]|jgi:L-rhamnose-H+ transport protein|nr:L-rhamnose/proton symporter RhaT [Chitinophagaceae bacterium]